MCNHCGNSGRIIAVLRSGLAAAALFAAAPAFAQPQTGTPAQGREGMTPPPAFMQAAQHYGDCIGNAVGAAGTTVAPEAAAAQALSSCRQQRSALETAFDAWLDSPAFPEAGKAEAREQFRARLAGAQTELADQIRRSRSASAGN
jgi:hypothetical protein